MVGEEKARKDRMAEERPKMNGAGTTFWRGGAGSTKGGSPPWALHEFRDFAIEEIAK